jgi:hypothetical protein
MIHTRPLMREDPFMRDTNTHHLGAVFDEHVADEFVVRDVAATMATMTPDPIVIYIPKGAGLPVLGAEEARALGGLLDSAVNP